MPSQAANDPDLPGEWGHEPLRLRKSRVTVKTGSPDRRAVGTLWRYFLRLGALGFGGPVALVARMRADLVDGASLISEEDFRDGLALAQVAPGPLAAQLAMYMGWVAARTVGAAVVGAAFVLPSLLIVLGIAAVYKSMGGLPIITRLFYGVGAAVIAVLARAAFRLMRTTIPRERTLWSVVALNAGATALLQRESIPLVLGSGVATFGIAWIAERRRARVGRVRSRLLSVTPGALLLLPTALSTTPLLSIFAFFALSGLVVFGSGLAIVPFLHGGVVLQRHWLTEQQFLDAVAVSLLTPGPVVITVAFIGYLVAGLSGGLAAALGVFLPPFVIVIAAAPHFGRVRNDKRVRAFSNGVTAAAIGALVGAVVVMASRTITDGTTALIASGALLILLVRPKTPEPAVLAAAALVGLLIPRA